ncbi:hypothetical protein ACKFKF_30865 [Phormidesmis sp. 146-12]
MTQEKMTDDSTFEIDFAAFEREAEPDWKARQEALEAIGYDVVLTNPQQANPKPIILDAIEREIYRLFGQLPVDQQSAVLVALQESLEVDDGPEPSFHEYSDDDDDDDEIDREEDEPSFRRNGFD